MRRVVHCVVTFEMSPLSSSSTRRPLMAASRAIPAPFMPAPTTTTSKGRSPTLSNNLSRSSFTPYCLSLLRLAPEERAPGHVHGLIQGDDLVQVAHQGEVLGLDDPALGELGQGAADDPDGSHTFQRHSLQPLVLALEKRPARRDELTRLHVAPAHAGDEHVPDSGQPVGRLGLSA